MEADVLGFDDGVAADEHALVVTQCQPGGPGLTFYVDGQQQIRTAATAAVVDDTDGGVCGARTDRLLVLDRRAPGA